jgi:hypothetical protein
MDMDREGGHGRGLWLVEALSEDWGAFRPAHASGKVIWPPCQALNGR